MVSHLPSVVNIGIMIVEIIMVSACDAPLQDHMIKGACDFIDWSSSLRVTTRPGLVAIKIMKVEIWF